MAQHLNFYENLQEAQMRLQGTIVVYDGEPYQVYHITEHKDKILRVYMHPINQENVSSSQRPNLDNFLYSNGNDRSKIPEYLDKWMEDNPKFGMLRKKMNSPAFNKFRPFPLGMVNDGKGRVFYVERQ